MSNKVEKIKTKLKDLVIYIYQIKFDLGQKVL